MGRKRLAWLSRVDLMATSSWWRDGVLIIPSLLSCSSLRPPRKLATSTQGTKTDNADFSVQGGTHRGLGRIHHLW